MITTAAKKNVQLAFEDVLKKLDVLRREPNPAEQLNLVDALCSMASGQYIAAASKIFEARRLVSNKRVDACSTQPSVTKDMMRRGLMHLRIHR